MIASCAAVLVNVPSAALAQASANIVVIGKRQGAADLDPEYELDEDAIAAQQADSISQLMRRIAPMMGGNDDQPVLIVNGKRIADPKEIAGYPPEALQRAEVLPQEAAARYGYAPEKRVVNLVLKRQFDSWVAEAGVRGPVAGGQDSETLNIQKTVVAGEARWSIEGKLDRSSRLRQAARSLPPSPDMVLFGDDTDYRTILPSTASASLTASVARPIGSANLSLFLRAGKSKSRRWLGLPRASLMLPPDSPFFDAAQGDVIYRLLPQAEAMTGQQERDYIGLSANVRGRLLGINAALALSYDHDEARNRTTRGYDLSAAQARLSAGDPDLDPFGPLPLGRRLDDRTRSSGDSLTATVVLNNAFKLMPAGQGAWTIAANFNRASNSSHFENSGVTTYDDAIQHSGDVRITVALPLASRRMNVLPFLGEMSLNLSGGALLGGSAPPRGTMGAGLFWSPVKALILNMQANAEGEASAVDQPNAPIVETPNVRIYDFARGELAEVNQISGGNPDLRRGSSRSWSIGGAVRAFGSNEPFLTFDYRHREIRNAIGRLPALTEIVEAAFPERVVRDSEGRLVEIDNRPINFASDTSESLRSAINARIKLGPPPPPAATADGGWRGPASVQLTLSHEWQLRNLLSIRKGIPSLDKLKGQGGGQSRHVLKLQSMISLRGVGLVLDARWQSAYRTLAGSDGPSAADLRFSGWLSSNLALRLYPSNLDILGRPDWLGSTRFEVKVDNLFDARRKVTRADGTVPPGYSRDESDPLGRVVQLSIRRRF